jgi:hypothetical protein
MYNNPGALKRPSPDISAWGYIRNDARWFLIFPDMATGQRAAVEVKEIVYHRKLIFFQANSIGLR